MFWAAAAYNNGIVPFKHSILGEAYTRDGKPASLIAPVKPTPEMTQRSRHHRPDLSAARLGGDAARRRLPRVRARRPQHHHRSFPRSACRIPTASCSASRSRGGPTSASRTAAPAPGCASPSRSSTSPRRASTIPSPGSSAPTTIRATIATRAAPSCHVVYANNRDVAGGRPLRQIRQPRHQRQRRPDHPQRAKPAHPLRHRDDERRSRPPVHDLPHAPAEPVHEHVCSATPCGTTRPAAPEMWPKEQKYPRPSRDARGARAQPRGRGRCAASGPIPSSAPR